MSNPFAESERLGNVLVIAESDWWKNKAPNPDTIDKIKNFLPEYKWQNEFSDERRALLFKPGYYQGCGFELGYYQQMVGLGAAAKDVRFTGYTDPKDNSFPHCGPNVADLYPSRPDSSVGGGAMALDSFWRSAENFSTENGDGINWHVSQAAPLRRIKCDGKLKLANGGQCYSSGGFIANAEVGSVEYGTQQQYYHRNVKFHSKPGCPSYNGVYSGCMNPPNEGADHRISVEPTPRNRIEKPFIVFNDNKKEYELHVPAATTNATEGPNLGPIDKKDVRTFGNVTVVNPVGDYTKTLQDALSMGNDIIIAPGIYYLKSSLYVSANYKNQVILGLGMATLVAPLDGTPCIKVNGGSEGIRIAGLLLQASVLHNDAYQGSSLLDFGTSGVKDGNPANPGLLSDVFARVGNFSSTSSRAVSVETMIRIFSGHVVGDNIWLWRADHDIEGKVKSDDLCKVDHALYVEGDYVTMYGLFAEHVLKDITVWVGNHGETHFYQCELNYYASQGDASIGYNVTENVTHHYASGAGVYCMFMNGKTIEVPYGIHLPQRNFPDVRMKNPFVNWIVDFGKFNSVVKIDNETNGRGGATTNRGVVRLNGSGPVPGKDWA